MTKNKKGKIFIMSFDFWFWFSCTQSHVAGVATAEAAAAAMTPVTGKGGEVSSDAATGELCIVRVTHSNSVIYYFSSFIFLILDLGNPPFPS